MSIYKRGNVYWYKFMWNGEPVRESTKQGNNKMARDAESKHRTRLVSERDECKSAAEQLHCESVLRCCECQKWFDASVVVEDLSKRQFCGKRCHSDSAKRYAIAPSIQEFCSDRFGPWIMSTTAQKTWLDFYRVGLRAIEADTAMSSLKMDDVTSESIVGFAIRRRAQKGGLQVSTVNCSLRVLRRVMRQALEWGVIQSVPKITMLPGERHRERVLSYEEEARYLAAASRLLASVATVLADTGMRPEECYRLRWESITWTAGRNGTLLVTHGKTKAARRVLPLTPRVRTVLESLWQQSRQPEEGWVWPTATKSGHIEPSSLKKQHRKALKDATIRHFVLYSLRHTFLTRLGESGCDAWTLARIAGHNSISISSRYVHPSEDAVLTAVDRLSGHKTGHTGKKPARREEQQLLLNAVNSKA